MGNVRFPFFLFFFSEAGDGMAFLRMQFKLSGEKRCLPSLSFSASCFCAIHLGFLLRHFDTFFFSRLG